MADSIRRRIRTRALALLTGLPTTGPRVWPRRDDKPLVRTELPALFVAVDDGGGVYGTAGFGVSQRSARLAIEAVVVQAGDFDDALETIWSEIEPALAGDPTLAGAIKHFGDWSLTARQSEVAGELVLIRQALLLQCHWYAPFGQPDASF